MYEYKIKSIDHKEEEIHTGEGYFVVMGSFETLSNAKVHQQAIKRSGVGEPTIVQNKAKTYFYVCLSSFDNYKDAV